MNGHYPPSEPFEPIMLETLKDPLEASMLLQLELEDALKDGDTKYFLSALSLVTKAQGGFSKLAKETGLGRESLYSALSDTGNPRWDTISKVLDALGFRLSIQPVTPARKIRKPIRKRPVAARSAAAKPASRRTRSVSGTKARASA